MKTATKVLVPALIALAVPGARLVRQAERVTIRVDTAARIAAQRYQVDSPDGRTQFMVEAGSRLAWSLSHAGRLLIEPSPISMTLASGQVFGHEVRFASAEPRSVDTVIRPAVAEKNASIPDHFRELRLETDQGWGLVIRAYDDGVAWRFTAALPDSIEVMAEEATFRFAGNYTAVFGADSLWMSHQEPLYRRVLLDDLQLGLKGLMPLVIEVEDGPRMVIMESALESYPGMHVARSEGRSVIGVFPPVALEEDLDDIQNVRVRRYGTAIARTEGRRDFPWRVLAIAADDRALLENQIVYRLAPEMRLEDPSWIRPGKVAWDWWNDWNLHDVEFRAGINQRTYQHYIDFAHEFGIDYVILDMGWSPLDDLLTSVEEIDVPALVEYGRQRDVGIILWALWKPLDLRMEEVLVAWEAWGIKGIKVDYMQRDDQALVEFYWRLAREAAARRMVLDFHGAYKPAGLRRAWPNVLSREGVRGLEYNKWSRDITPAHDVTLPFTRMIAGPMDYTPGAMINAARREHQPIFSRPMSQGTRAHQMALYVVFESPLQMLADNPTHYRREPEVTRFIAGVPTTWDETRALLGASGQHVALARRKGDRWWIGALTDWQARNLSIDLSFLGDGAYTMVLYRDGINADRYGSDHVRETRTVRRSDRLDLVLAPGGGWVARLDPAS